MSDYEIKLRSDFFDRYTDPRSRYFMVEGDGSRVERDYGRMQRPKAELAAMRSGCGLWDNREKVMLIQPDPERRARHFRGLIAHEREQIVAHEAVLERIIGNPDLPYEVAKAMIDAGAA